MLSKKSLVLIGMQGVPCNKVSPLVFLANHDTRLDITYNDQTHTHHQIERGQVQTIRVPCNTTLRIHAASQPQDWIVTTQAQLTWDHCWVRSCDNILMQFRSHVIERLRCVQPRVLWTIGDKIYADWFITLHQRPLTPEEQQNAYHQYVEAWCQTLAPLTPILLNCINVLIPDDHCLYDNFQVLGPETTQGFYLLHDLYMGLQGEWRQKYTFPISLSMEEQKVWGADLRQHLGITSLRRLSSCINPYDNYWFIQQEPTSATKQIGRVLLILATKTPHHAPILLRKFQRAFVDYIQKQKHQEQEKYELVIMSNKPRINLAMGPTEQAYYAVCGRLDTPRVTWPAVTTGNDDDASILEEEKDPKKVSSASAGDTGTDGSLPFFDLLHEWASTSPWLTQILVIGGDYHFGLRAQYGPHIQIRVTSAFAGINFPLAGQGSFLAQIQERFDDANFYCVTTDHFERIPIWPSQYYQGLLDIACAKWSRWCDHS